MEWVASTLHTTSEHGVSNITTTDAHTSAASIRLNWRPHRFKWTRPFRRKTKYGFCACAITFQLASTTIRRQETFFSSVCLFNNAVHCWYYVALINDEHLSMQHWWNTDRGRMMSWRTCSSAASYVITLVGLVPKPVLRGEKPDFSFCGHFACSRQSILTFWHLTTPIVVVPHR